MRSIWNPWHGCIKKSDGCLNCYVYYFDKKNNKDASLVYKVKTNFNYPISTNKQGNYKLESGTLVITCITSDFFIKEADEWREEAWDIIRKREDLIFFIITKRPERIKECLPKDWNDGFENVWINISAENQKTVDERIPILKSLPIKHRGIILAPLLEEVTIEKYLEGIDKVVMDKENYEGARPFDINWALKVREECIRHNVTFDFSTTKDDYIYNDKRYEIKENLVKRQSESNLNYKGKDIVFNLKENMQLQLF